MSRHFRVEKYSWRTRAGLKALFCVLFSVRRLRNGKRWYLLLHLLQPSRRRSSFRSEFLMRLGGGWWRVAAKKKPVCSLCHVVKDPRQKDSTHYNFAPGSTTDGEAYADDTHIIQMERARESTFSSSSNSPCSWQIAVEIVIPFLGATPSELSSSDLRPRWSWTRWGSAGRKQWLSWE